LAQKRSFSPDGIGTMSIDYHGTVRFTRCSPDLVPAGVKSLNLDTPFDEAVKLTLALQCCVQSLNRYNRSTTKGKSMGLLLSVKLDTSTVAVIESPIRSAALRATLDNA
jgi:hypothetical protein